MSRRKIIKTNLTFDDETFSEDYDSTKQSNNADDETSMDPKNMFNVLNMENHIEQKLEQIANENKEKTKSDSKSAYRLAKDINTPSQDDIEKTKMCAHTVVKQVILNIFAKNQRKR